METQVGLELCTAGNAETLTINGQCTIVPGMLIIHSPVFPMLELSRSAEYASEVLQDDIGNIYSLFSQNIPSPQHIYAITPFVYLSDAQQQFFLQRVDAIAAKERQLATINNPLQRNILTTVINLLKQETIMEHAFLFSEQLMQDTKPPSHKRQVLMTFLLSLNQEYKQHRTVQYYAEKQALTTRHFADIVKHETGYTPMEWINMVTINQAKNLLRQPDILVKQVAEELGFPEQFTFRKYFKTHTGISPSEYQTRRQ